MYNGKKTYYDNQLYRSKKKLKDFTLMHFKGDNLYCTCENCPICYLKVGANYLCHNLKSFLMFLASCFAVAVFLVLFTPLGFPFSGNPNGPSPKRVLPFVSTGDMYIVGKFFMQLI